MSPNRCVWVTGSPPVCLATCTRCVPTCGWSTWLCTSSFSAGWSTTSSSAIKWVLSSRTLLATRFGCQSSLLLCAAVVKRIVHIVSSPCNTAPSVSQLNHDIVSTIGWIMYYLILLQLFDFLVVLPAVIFSCCSSMKEATQERLSYFCQSHFLHLQVSACVPVLRLSRHRKKVLFYCHFPDQLLTQRKSTLKKLYRAPIDWVEERTTGMADMVGDSLNFGVSVMSVERIVQAFGSQG